MKNRLSHRCYSWCLVGWILAVLMVALANAGASPTTEENNSRRGVVFGLGVGVCNLPFADEEDYEEISRYEAVLQFELGAGLDAKNELLVQWSISFRGTKGSSGGYGPSFPGLEIDKNFYFISWRRYLRLTKPSLFVGAGIGKYDDGDERVALWKAPLSVMASAGYELNHFVLAAYAMWINFEAKWHFSHSGIHLGAIVNWRIF